MYTFPMSYHSLVDGRCLLGQVEKTYIKSLCYQYRNNPTHLQMQTLGVKTFVYA